MHKITNSKVKTGSGRDWNKKLKTWLINLESGKKKKKTDKICSMLKENDNKYFYIISRTRRMYSRRMASLLQIFCQVFLLLSSSVTCMSFLPSFTSCTSRADDSSCTSQADNSSCISQVDDPRCISTWGGWASNLTIVCLYEMPNEYMTWCHYRLNCWKDEPKIWPHKYSQKPCSNKNRSRNSFIKTFKAVLNKGNTQ